MRGNNPLCTLVSGKIENKPLDPTRVNSVVSKTLNLPSLQLSKTKLLNKGEIEIFSCPEPRKSPYYTHITIALGTRQWLIW